MRGGLKEPAARSLGERMVMIFGDGAEGVE